MTRQKLRQIRHLKKEIELLQDQIASLEGEIVTDKVRGSDPEHPWTEKSFYITGFGQEKYSRKMNRLKRRPVAGSGVTLLAAEQMGRKGYGFEIKREYVREFNEKLAGSVQRSVFNLQTPKSIGRKK